MRKPGVIFTTLKSVMCNTLTNGHKRLDIFKLYRIVTYDITTDSFTMNCCYLQDNLSFYNILFSLYIYITSRMARILK